MTCRCWHKRMLRASAALGATCGTCGGTNPADSCIIVPTSDGFEAAMQFEEFESFDTVSTAPVATAAASPLVRLQYLIDNTPAIIYATVPSGDFKMTFVSKNAF